MVLNEFISLEEFHSHTMRPGEAIALYIHDLKRLLQQAMPGLTATVTTSYARIDRRGK